MKLLTVIASCLLLCSCADMVVTRSTSTASASRAQVDAKDFDAKESVRFQTNCGIGAAHPAAIYIRPFCIDGATFRGDETASAAEMPIRQSLVPVAFAEELKEKLSQLAPTRVLEPNEYPRVGWLVDGQFELVDGGSKAGRFFLGPLGVGQSMLALHVRVTDVQAHRVIYEFDLAGGSRGQGPFGTLRAGGLGDATAFDLHNAAERILLVLSPDAFHYGEHTSLTLR